VPGGWGELVVVDFLSWFGTVDNNGVREAYFPIDVGEWLMNIANVLKASDPEPYRETLEQRYEWELLGAEEKAQSIIQLTHGFEIRSILEIGTGTGALLETLDKLGFAEHYYGMEPSSQAFQFVMNRKAISRLVAMGQGTLEQCGLTDRQYDLVILSHVLEHVDNPAGLLSKAMPLARFVLIEIPLEGNSCGNFRAAVKSTATGVPRHNNYAGHIQFFSSWDIQRLVYWSGGEVVRSRLYVPIEGMKRMSARGSWVTRAYRKFVLGLCHIFGEAHWGRLYHGHYAVLARPREPIGEKERTLWPSSHYYP